MYEEYLKCFEPTRLEILNLIVQNDRICPSCLKIYFEIAGKSISKPAIAQHLGILKNAKLIKMRRDGNRLFYSKDQKHVDELRVILLRLLPSKLEKKSEGSNIFVEKHHYESN